MKAWAMQSARIVDSSGKMRAASPGFCSSAESTFSVSWFAMPLCVAQLPIGWARSFFGNSSLPVFAELSRAGSWLRGSVCFANAKVDAFSTRNGSSINLSEDAHECGENYPPEQIESCAGVYFVRAGTQARHHHLLRVLSCNRRHSRFFGARRRGKATAPGGMARDAPRRDSRRADPCAGSEALDCQGSSI